MLKPSTTFLMKEREENNRELDGRKLPGDPIDCEDHDGEKKDSTMLERGGAGESAGRREHHNRRDQFRRT